MTQWLCKICKQVIHAIHSEELDAGEIKITYGCGCEGSPTWPWTILPEDRAETEKYAKICDEEQGSL